jgi:RNA ligase (TIGR02306 family)
MDNKASHRVEVVPVVLEPHPNADILSICRVFGYSCVVRTEEWKDRKIGAYIPPDSVCPNTPEYSFLENLPGTSAKRIRTVRLRGILSLGLLMPAPEGSKIGDNVADIMGITHYEPPSEMSGGQAIGGPSGLYCPKYDIDTIRRFNHLFTPGEPVYVTEKIHGECMRVTYHDGRMQLGSRDEWKKRTDDSEWWANLTPEIEAFCRAHEHCILFGESYGKNKGFKYGDNAGIRFVAFDVLDGTNWYKPLDFIKAVEEFNVPHVPVLAMGLPFDFEKIQELAEGPSILAQDFGAEHVREGCVVKPMEERVDLEIGRVVLKLVGNGYYGDKQKRKEEKLKRKEGLKKQDGGS